MKKIGLISDTHGHLDDSVFKHFKHCDEVWHAGDIGTMDVFESLEKWKPLRAVYGNIDGTKIRTVCPEILEFELEGVKVLMIHIAGRPPKYSKGIIPLIKEKKPQLFICGHSHILRVEFDKKLNTLYMNPGAAGKSGFHHVKTLLRFDLNKGKIQNLEVIELGKRA